MKLLLLLALAAAANYSPWQCISRIPALDPGWPPSSAPLLSAPALAGPDLATDGLGIAEQSVEPAHPTFANVLGVYHWGGGRHLAVDKGVDLIAGMGGHVARIVLSSRYYSDYGNSSKCYPNFSLLKLAQEPAMQRALDNRNIRTFILTTYDGVTFGDCQTLKFLNPRFYTPDIAARVRAEYRDLTNYLVERYAGSGRRFIIANWESDNAIYCNAAYSYATIPSFRASCDSTYPTKYAGNSGPRDSMTGMRRWFGLRQQGIEDGLNRARRAGWSDVEVVHAPEVNLVTTLEANGFPSVLHSVLANGDVKWVSYSSYEAINSASPEATLRKDIRLIRAVTGAPNVLIGEAGFQNTVRTAPSQLEAVTRAALAEGVREFIVWNLDNQSQDYQFGVFDQNGTITPIGQMVERMLHSPGAPQAR